MARELGARIRNNHDRRADRIAFVVSRGGALEELDVGTRVDSEPRIHGSRATVPIRLRVPDLLAGVQIVLCTESITL